MQIGLPIVSTVCANCPNTITTSDNQSLCRYHRQRVHAECETTRIGTHARLVYSDIAGDSETVVIDEDALPTIRKFVSLDKQDIQSALSWWQASGLPQGEACAIVCDNLLAAIDNGGASHEPVLLPPLAFKSNGWHQAVWEDKSAPQESATAIMKLTAGDYAEVGACSSNVVIVFGSNSFHNKRIVYLDTTANQELLTRALFRQTVAGVDLTAMSGACQPMKDLTPTGSVAIAQRPIQIPELDITIGSDHDAKAKRLARYIVALIAKHDYQRISVIGHSKHTDAIKKYVPSEFHWRLLDFFYFRQGGSNYWHNMRCDCLIVAGTPRVPTEAVRDQLAAFGYWGVTIPDMVSCQVHIDGQTFVSRKYASADVQMVYEYLVNAPLLQAIGRSRPLQSEVRCDTYILSNAIIPSWYPRIEPPGVLNEITDRTVDVSQAVARLSKDGKDVSTTAIATHLAMGARYVREVLQVARNLNLVIQVGERSGYLPSAVWQRNSHPSISG